MRYGHVIIINIIIVLYYNSNRGVVTYIIVNILVPAAAEHPGVVAAVDG